MKEVNFRTLNVRGCRDEFAKRTLCDEVGRQNLQFLGFTESHIVGKENTEDVLINIKGRRKSYKFFKGGITGKNNFSGVGCIIDADLQPTFRRFTDRICVAEAYTEKERKHKMVIITAYAPTLLVSEKDPKFREDFYNKIESLLHKEKRSKNTVILLGDFNAKTGSGHRIYKENMGKYGKGEMNSNGEHLLNTLRDNGMVITNNLFPHRLSHRTTWTAPERRSDTLHHDSSIRRNPFRNQIDYIITKIGHKYLINDSRSYDGLETYTDHRLVKMTMKLQWWKLPRNQVKQKCYNTANFNNDEIRADFKQKVKLGIENLSQSENPNEIWNNLTEICKTSAEASIGFSKRGKQRQKIKNLRIYQLSRKN